MCFDTILQVIATVLVAAAGFVLNWRWRKSDEKREEAQKASDARRIVTSALAELTSGEVEDARHLVGTIRYGKLDDAVPSEREVVRAYYRLTWAVEAAGAAILAASDLDTRVAADARAKQLEWHLKEIVRNVELLSGALVLEDEEAASRRRAVVTELQGAGGEATDQDWVDTDSETFKRDLSTLMKTLEDLAIRVRSALD